MRHLRFIAASLTAATLVAAAFAAPVSAQQAPAQPEPEVQDVYIVMRDMGLEYENVVIRTIVPNEEGASALVGLTGGTLVDVSMTPTAVGWTLRDIYYVAGNSEEFSAWSGPWRRRVADAERFLAAASDDGTPTRTAEELAPLVWFEDIEDQRLWGLNPTTYRVMQTLKMMPRMGGPMGGGDGR